MIGRRRRYEEGGWLPPDAPDRVLVERARRLMRAMLDLNYEHGPTLWAVNPEYLWLSRYVCNRAYRDLRDLGAEANAILAEYAQLVQTLKRLRGEAR